MLYKDLVVWQKAHGLALKTIRAVDSMQSCRATNVVATQLLSAVTSVGANIAEGYGRNAGKEYARFLHIAYGSANEVDNWLTVTRDANLLPANLADELLSDNQEILRILWTMLRRLGDNAATTRNRITEDTPEYTSEVPNENR
ncbi:MAG: four helix bundle protein [Dehalococcoidales bacterium]|nr:four helix bundle protein [Dehalococcoidales bacterium]